MFQVYATALLDVAYIMHRLSGEGKRKEKFIMEMIWS